MASAGALALAAALAVSPFGQVSELIQKQNPWHGFDDHSALLWNLRVEKLEAVECEKLVKRLEEDFPAQQFVEPKPKHSPKIDWSLAWKGWKPWSAKDLKLVTDCDDFPCKVKLNATEVGAMAKEPETGRLEKFQSLVKARVERYLKTEERKEYEFPGDPVDPWSEIRKQVKGSGSVLYQSPYFPKDAVTLWARRLDFAPGRIQPIRQILDRRVWEDATRTQVEVWIRDSYTDHYFDGWGEWAHLGCDPETHRAILIQALVSDLDLLKKHDIISSLATGRMKSAIEENGAIYLDSWAAKVKGVQPGR
jgi:hypothetical protein